MFIEKKLFIFFAVVFTSSVIGSTQVEYHCYEAPMDIYCIQWGHWKRLYRKYFTEKTEHMRFNTWVANLKEINEHNDRYAEGKELYLAALTKFACRLPSHWLEILLPGVSAPVFHKDQTAVVFHGQKIPSYVNWVSQGWTTQRTVGTLYPIGWVYSAIQSVEAQYYNITGRNAKFSKQEVIDCVVDSPGRPHITVDAFSYVLENGTTFDELYPSDRFNPKRRPCRNQERRVITHIRNFHSLPSGDEETIMIAVAQIGPLSVSITATDKFFFYKTGVFYDTMCENQNKSLNHAVLLVGYGIDANLGPYWIIENTWGIGWGEGGYGRMARNTKIDCGITSAAFYPVF